MDEFRTSLKREDIITQRKLKEHLYVIHQFLDFQIVERLSIVAKVSSDKEVAFNVLVAVLDT